MKIYPDWITGAHEGDYIGFIQKALEHTREVRSGSRNRILRYGWDYTNPDKWNGDIPMWIPEPPHDFGGFDNLTINEYLEGQSIAPHIDSNKFGDVAILTLANEATMRFTHATSREQDFVLPRRSLAIMSGELRSDWRHSTLPLVGEVRYSVVYRKRL